MIFLPCEVLSPEQQHVLVCSSSDLAMRHELMEEQSDTIKI